MALVGWIAYRKTAGEVDTRDGYFLAGRGLTGGFIAGSLLLTNLSAEQLIGLNGSAFAFNMTAMQVTPESLAAAIREHIPEFAIEYDVDPIRQAIADSWPRRIDDTAARDEWNWNPEYDLAAMTADMIAHLQARG